MRSLTQVRRTVEGTAVPSGELRSFGQQPVDYDALTAGLKARGVELGHVDGPTGGKTNQALTARQAGSLELGVIKQKLGQHLFRFTEEEAVEERRDWLDEWRWGRRR